MLKRAMIDTEKSCEMPVRVSGFSADFTTLAQTIQDDVVARTEH